MPIQYGARYINTQVAGQVVCGGLLLLMIREKKDSLFKYPLWAISIFWLSVLIASFVFSVARLASLEELMRNVMYISLPIILYSWCSYHDRIKLLSYTVISSGTLISGIAIFNFLRDYIHTMTFTPASEPLTRTNDLGAFMLLIFPLSLSNFLYEDEEPLEKAVYALTTILSFVTIIMTFSRGIWLSTLIAVVLILFLGRKILKKNLIYIGIVAILSVLPIIFNWEKIAQRLFSLQNIFNNAENSIEWRKSLLRGTWNMFLDNPIIGTGLNTFPSAFSAYQERAGYFSINPHNYYLQLLAETGVIGFTAFIVLALSILYMSFKAFANSEKIFKGIALGLLVSIISSLIHIFVDIDWSVAAIPIMFWIEVGLLISIYSLVNFKETRFTESNDHFNYLKKPILILISASLIIIPTMNYVSLTYYSKAISELNNQDIEQADKSNRMAIRISPWASSRHSNSQAIILEKQNKLEDALAYADRAIKLDKYNYVYYTTYTNILKKLRPNAKQEVINSLITSVKYNPYTHPKLYGEIGDYYEQKMNNHDEAILWYKDAIAHFPLNQIVSYERYGPDDRYELYKIYKSLANVMNKGSKGSGNGYLKTADFLLRTEPGASEDSENSSQVNSSPIVTIKNYYKEFYTKEKNINKFIYPGITIFSPPPNFSYKILDFINIEREYFSAVVEYKLLLTDNKTKSSREVILIDNLALTDNGWFISQRKKKD